MNIIDNAQFLEFDIIAQEIHTNCDSVLGRKRFFEIFYRPKNIHDVELFYSSLSRKQSSIITKRFFVELNAMFENSNKKNNVICDENKVFFINVEPLNLDDLKFEISNLKNKLKMYGIDLVVELTERIQVCNIVEFKEVSDAIILLHGLNVSFALDDFDYTDDVRSQWLNLGVVDYIKIILPGLNQRSVNSLFDEFIYNVIKSYGVSVVVEKIETDEELIFLRSTAANFLQGYCLSRPMKINGYLQF